MNHGALVATTTCEHWWTGSTEKGGMNHGALDAHVTVLQRSYFDLHERKGRNEAWGA